MKCRLLTNFPTTLSYSINFPSLDVANADAFSMCNDILALKREVAENSKM